MQGPAAQEREAVAAEVAEGRVSPVACRGGGHAAAAFPPATWPTQACSAHACACVPSMACTSRVPTPAGRHRGAPLTGTTMKTPDRPMICFQSDLFPTFYVRPPQETTSPRKPSALQGLCLSPFVRWLSDMERCQKLSQALSSLWQICLRAIMIAGGSSFAAGQAG